MGMWNSARWHYKNGGVHRVSQVICRRGLLPTWLYFIHRTEILALNHLPLKSLPPRDLHGFAFGKGHTDDVHALAKITDGNSGRLEDLFARFLQQGHDCFVLRKGNAIVGYYWGFREQYTVTDDDYRLRQCHLALSHNQVFFGNGFIHDEYRLKGLFPFLVRYSLSNYPVQTNFFTSIDYLNDPSLSAHRRLGFGVVASICCHRMGGSPFFWTVRRGERSTLLGWNSPRVPLSCVFEDNSHGARPVPAAG